jgi:hypothetical protein
MNNSNKDGKWYILFAKTPHMKVDWMDAFRRERQQVLDDKANGFVITPKMKRAALAIFNFNSEISSGRKSVSKRHQDLLTTDSLSLPRNSGRHEVAFNKINNSPNEKKKPIKRRK